MSQRSEGAICSRVDDQHRATSQVPTCTGDQEALIDLDPERFFRPAYLGVKGWVSVRLDLHTVDWEEVTKLVGASYRLVAPKRLAALAGPPASHPSPRAP